MKKFRFSLRSVATIRAIRELRAREQFSIAVKNLTSAEEKVELLRQRVTRIEELMRSGRTGAFRAGDQISFISALQAEITATTKATGELEKARIAMEAARQGWLSARRDVRVTDKLEQKARDLHRHETEREDQAALDDRTGSLTVRTAHAL